MSLSHCLLFVALFAAALPKLLGAAELHVCSTCGLNTNPGDALAPVRTIQRAADLAQPGDVISVAPGVYRERVAPPRGGKPDRPIVFRSQVRLQAIIKGSDVWEPLWRQEGGPIWSGEVSPDLFTDKRHVDGANPFEVALASTPWGREGRPEKERGYPGAHPDVVYSLGQVIVDGGLFRQAPLRSELEAQSGTWYYDAATKRLYVHFHGEVAPEDRFVEITTRRRIFAPHLRGLGHIEIDGFVMEHCGNQYPADFWKSEHPENQQAGAVGTRSGHHWYIHDNMIRFARGIGLDLGMEGHPDVDLETGGQARPQSAGYHRVINNAILDNGAGGTASYGGRNLLVKGNVIMRNNALEFTGKKRWESAGIKLHSPHHSVIHGNYIAHNKGKWGLWLDQGAGRDTRITGNVIIGHKVGLDFEIGQAWPVLVANNILIDNEIGLGAREAGGIHAIHNLILGSDESAVHSSINARRSEPWNAANLRFHGNIIVSTSGSLYTMTAPDAFRSGARSFDDNLYGEPEDRKGFVITAHGEYPFAGWQGFWHKENGGEGSDQRSQIVSKISYAFDEVTHDLTLHMPVDPRSFQLASPGELVFDYLGERLPRDDAAIPGPFQSLKQGLNTLRIWSGIQVYP